ncbi:hypothetical protein GCM10011332_25130 [Terasakiella brassicae]|uniref:Uncharacterized protein n=1 Tax=Terasakiella brassicae TaxID=1634917 RepID=A0A917FFA6_9PROT|nr:hypothetical protein GCM10011332_25130 [Terasakiella brassicae]
MGGLQGQIAFLFNLKIVNNDDFVGQALIVCPCVEIKHFDTAFGGLILFHDRSPDANTGFGRKQPFKNKLEVA